MSDQTALGLFSDDISVINGSKNEVVVFGNF